MSVYFLLHVPKTAGVTIAEHLAEHCDAGALWRPQPARFLEGIGALPDFERVRAVALGHYRGKSLESYFPGRELRRAVLLRDPISLQVSYYNWRMMYFLHRGQGTYSFATHLRALPRNFVMHFLLRHWLELPWPALLTMPDAKKFDLLQRHLSQFWFVGGHTDCGRLIAALAPELGVPPVAVPRNTSDQWRNFVDWRPLEASKLSGAQRDAILADHPLDQALWDEWHGVGFDIPRTRARRVAPPLTSGAARHDLLRPAYELARLCRRGWPRRIDGDACPQPLARIRMALRRRGRMTGDDLLELLHRTPTDPDLWRAYHTLCRRMLTPANLPATLAMSLDNERDPALCILKGEILLWGGRGDEAKRFLRFAPALARTRRQGREITLRAAPQDSEFRDLVLRADDARDKQDWREGARLYRAALDLYPGHCGYMVQYAHCLKEGGDYVAAEIYYRSARALGAPAQDVQSEIRFVAAIQGHDEVFDESAAGRPTPNGVSLLDDPPTRADIDIACSVIAGVAHDDLGYILRTLRSVKTISELLDGISMDHGLPAQDNQRGGDLGARFLDARLALAASKVGATPARHEASRHEGGGAESSRAPALGLV